MYIKITSKKYKGKITKHAKIVKGYKEDGKVKHETILNLGAMNSEEDNIKFQKILQEMKMSDKGFIKLENFVTESAKEYGVTYVVNQLLEKYGLDRILKDNLSKNKATYNVYEVVKALIINRLIKPGSDLFAYDWIKNDYSKELKIEKQYIYRSLDHLIKQKDNIEKKIYDRLLSELNLNTDIIHYDLTSSYFEGKKCEIALYGYSRDHRKDRQQIVLGLVMCDGIPIYHEVWEGNTVDKATLKDTVNKLQQKLGLKNPIFVADRGLITADNLKELEGKSYRYLLGVERRNNNLAKDLFKNKIKSESQEALEVDELLIIKGDKEYKRRYILCFDNNTYKERIETLDKIKDKLEKTLTELRKKYNKSQASNRKNKMTLESLVSQALKSLGKNKRLFNFKILDKDIEYSLNKENWDYENLIAGKFLLVTNSNLSPKEAMKTYKKQQDVENAFDEIKNFLEIRPIEHHTENRVRAHVFVCVLSYLIESIIEKFSNESARNVLRQLERIQIVQYRLKKKRLQRLTMQPLEETKHIFKQLRINNPLYEMVGAKN